MSLRKHLEQSSGIKSEGPDGCELREARRAEEEGDTGFARTLYRGAAETRLLSPNLWHEDFSFPEVPSKIPKQLFLDETASYFLKQGYTITRKGNVDLVAEPVVAQKGKTRMMAIFSFIDLVSRHDLYSVQCSLATRENYSHNTKKD